MGNVVQLRDFDDIEQRVIAVVAEVTGHKRERVTPETLIESELGCTGDDARELMDRMKHEFRIDMSCMNFSRHFDSEGARGWPLLVAAVVAVPVSVLVMLCVGVATSLLSGWGGSFALPRGLFAWLYAACFLLIAASTFFLPHVRARRARKIPVTVQHLIDAARARRWPFSTSEGQAQ